MKKLFEFLNSPIFRILVPYIIFVCVLYFAPELSISTKASFAFVGFYVAIKDLRMYLLIQKANELFEFEDCECENCQPNASELLEKVEVKFSPKLCECENCDCGLKDAEIEKEESALSEKEMELLKKKIQGIEHNTVELKEGKEPPKFF